MCLVEHAFQIPVFFTFFESYIAMDPQIVSWVVSLVAGSAGGNMLVPVASRRSWAHCSP